MRASSTFSALAAVGLTAAQVQFDVSMLENNKMQNLMGLKTSHREAQRSRGMFAANAYKSAKATACTNGAAGEYSCENVDLQASLTHADMGSMTREGNDIWGWTSEDGREFALVGQTDGTAFVEVLPTGELLYIGRLPTQTQTSLWRDIKVIGNHAYIGSEASNHGIQIFDLTKLLDLDASSPTTFKVNSDLTALFKGFGSSHNIVANAETNMIYGVGAAQATCSGLRGGLAMVDVSDPANPTMAGCAGQDGYVHDAQCVMYSGMDADFVDHEICFAFNEDTFTIYDVTDKSNPVALSTTLYEGFNGKGAYTHQGWVLDEDFHYLLLDDELDEISRDSAGQDTHTTTYIFDISDLTSPEWTGQFKSPIQSIDHNQYVIDGISYQSNYASGLRIVDVSGIAEDPTGGNVSELGHFDCYPEDDESPEVEFYGAWSVYPYFKSGVIVMNCIERGLFGLKYTG